MKHLSQVGARLWLWLGQSDLRLAAGPGALGRLEGLPGSIARPGKPWVRVFWWLIPHGHQSPLALAAPNSLGTDLGFSNFTQSYGLEI